jgi:hypothetical protein
MIHDEQKQGAEIASPHAMPAETAGKVAIGCRPKCENMMNMSLCSARS